MTEPLHYQHWPKNVPRNFSLPQTSIYYNLEVSAARYPDQTAISYYGSRVTYRRVKAEVDALAGYMQRQCGVKSGDRVILYMQNSPQFIIAYYAVLRADAVVVPVNPMNLTEELRLYVSDAGAEVAISGLELYPRIEPLLRGNGHNGNVQPGNIQNGNKQPGNALKHIVVANYGDYVTEATDLPVPDFVRLAMPFIDTPGVTRWNDALAARCTPGPHLAGPDDLAALPYTSGTTGKPKGCLHTHSTLMATVVLGGAWNGASPNDVILAVVPFFHITGMQVIMNGTIYSGAELVVMTRWDRELALQLIRRHQVTSWTNIPTMVIDLFASANFKSDSLASLRHIGGGGAAMPEAVAKKLADLTGLSYLEGYGLTETAAPSHSNPHDGPKRQCLGIPVCNTQSLIIDPDTRKVLGVDEVGEIVTRGPQVFKGYWNNSEATRACFIDIGGKAFFRTGDLGRYDADGYFFIVDRLKRMINAAGFKVWPAEVESMMYAHPDIQEACVIGTDDAHRGETVKAVVVLKEAARDKVSEADIIAWCKEKIAAYKCPRIVAFADALPKSATGKVQWRLLQEQENAAR